MSLKLVISLREVERIEMTSTNAAEHRRCFDLLKEKYGDRKLELKVIHLNGKIFMVVKALTHV
jgi:hypothetical protein